MRMQQKKKNFYVFVNTSTHAHTQTHRRTLRQTDIAYSACIVSTLLRLNVFVLMKFSGCQRRTEFLYWESLRDEWIVLNKNNIYCEFHVCYDGFEISLRRIVYSVKFFSDLHSCYSFYFFNLKQLYEKCQTNDCLYKAKCDRSNLTFYSAK